MRLLLLLSAVTVAATSWLSPVQAAKLTAPELFDDSRVTKIEIEVTTNDLAVLRQQKLSVLKKRDKVSVTVREGERVYQKVAMRLKGSVGSFRSIDDKPALTLDFNEKIENQRFHGLKKIHLNNSVQDSIYMNERLCRELFLQAGIPCTRAGYATVKVNGRDLGVYVLVESYDRQFLKQHFKADGGNLYDIALGEELDTSGKQPVNSGDNPEEQGELKQLAAAVTEPALETRMRLLAGILDLDRFLTHLALDVLLHNWDGYGWGQNNYRIFYDQTARRLVSMPHGLDQTFQKPDVTITPRMYGAAARALLEIPEARDRYLGEMRRLLASVFKPTEMTNRVHQLARLVRPEIAARGAPDAAEFDTGVADYCSRIVRRVESVNAQLAGLAMPVHFDESGSLSVSNLTQSVDFGQPMIERLPDGVLRIAAGEKPAIARWARKIWLPQGQYRFEGRARAREIALQPGDRFGGAGLRVGGRRLSGSSPLSSGWTALSYEFEVTDPIFEVELVCELRAARGQVEFDENSLRVIRR